VLISANEIWLKTLYAWAWNCTRTRSVTVKGFESHPIEIISIH